MVRLLPQVLPFKLVLKYNAFLPCFLANKERLNGKAKDDFKNFIKKDYDDMVLLKSPKKLTYSYVKKINPEMIFFPDWSWIVNDKIINMFIFSTCTCLLEIDILISVRATSYIICMLSNALLF